jgi:ComF family protein
MRAGIVLGRALALGLADLLLPPRCAGCQEGLASGALCERCRRRIPGPPPGDPDENASSIRSLDRLFASASYAGDVERWVKAFKYPGHASSRANAESIAVVRTLARELAGEVSEKLAGHSPDAVVPVPLHPRRLRARGFNPAALLAREVARVLDAPFETRLLVRSRDTPTQTGLGRRGRAKNVAGAFRCTRTPPVEVWLVDDVATTGATLGECARTLTRAGSKRVVGVVLARTP